MKTVDGICKELRALDGVVGAFVLEQSECLATSLPSQYDPARLTQLGTVLNRVGQMAQKAGFDRSATAFHWQRASLLAWPCGDDAILGILAAPTAVREAVELSASMALEELAPILESRSTVEAAVQGPLGGTAPAQEDSRDLEQRFARIEQLLIEELGASGKALFERCQRRVPRGSLPRGEWLLTLRRTVLAEVPDPSARVTVAMSPDWAEGD